MDIHQLAAYSKMGCKQWNIVLQCVSNVFSKTYCNCITQCVALMVSFPKIPNTCFKNYIKAITAKNTSDRNFHSARKISFTKNVTLLAVTFEVITSVVNFFIY